jgi:transposase
MESEMHQISVKLPDDLTAALDEAATQLHRTRSELIRQAVEHYLDDFEDNSRAVEVLYDPADPILDWETVKHELLSYDERSV